MRGRLPKGPIRTWYEENHNIGTEINIRKYAEAKGYVFDRDLGLFLKPRFIEKNMLALNHTDINVLFPRPSDYHVHNTMSEVINVIGGSGAVGIGDMDNFSLLELSKGDEILLESGIHHAFRPDRDTFLEIEVACSELYTPDKEERIIAFNEFGPWIEYFSGKN